MAPQHEVLAAEPSSGDIAGLDKGWEGAGSRAALMCCHSLACPKELRLKFWGAEGWAPGQRAQESRAGGHPAFLGIAEQLTWLRPRSREQK